MNYHPVKGFILLAVLLMMSILSLFILSSMQTIFLYTKTSNQRVSAHQTIYQLETVALKLSKQSHFNCLISHPDFNQARNLLREKKGCEWRDKSIRYHYIINDLGSFPCLTIGPDVSHHWLISIISSLNPHVLLQLRFVTREKKVECKASDSRQMHAGIVVSLLTSI